MSRKLYKKITALSPAEIFIIITVIALAVFLVKFFGQKPQYRIIRVEVIPRNWVENYDPYGYRAPFWLSDKIKIGQEEKDTNSGKTIATLIGLENYERGGEEADLYLTLKVQVYLNSRNGKYLFKDIPLDLGSSIQLNLNNIFIQGQVVDTNVPLNGYPTKYFLATLRGKNIDPGIYSKVTSGQTMKNRTNNETVVQILSVKTENPTYQSIKIENSNLLVSTNQNKDLILSVKIKGYQIDGRWYFGGHQNLKIGGDFYLYTDMVSFNKLTIEDLEESPPR